MGFAAPCRVWPGARPLVLVVAVFAAGSASAASAKGAREKLAVLDVRILGVQEQEAAIKGLGSLLAAEAAAARPDLQVLTSMDVSTALGFDQQRRLMGCADSSCIAEIGGALGVTYLLHSEVTLIGSNWLLSLALIQSRDAQARRRLTKRATRVDDLVDVAIAGVRELLETESHGRPDAAAARPGPLEAAQRPSPAAAAPDARPLAAGATVPAASAPAATPAPAPQAASAVPAATIEATPGSSSRRTTGWVLGGTGLAFLAGAGVAYGLGYSEFLDQQKAGEAGDAARFESARSAAKRNLLISEIAGGLGVVLAGAGTYLLLTDTDEAPTATSFFVAPSASGLAWGLSGRFR